MTNRWLLLNFDTLDGLSVLVTTLLALSGVKVRIINKLL